MCNAFSCVVTKTGRVLWEFGKDSHDHIITKYGLSDDTYSPEKMEFARVEISPKNGNYLYPDKWELKVDESITPSWWSEWYEDESRLAWKEWKKELDKILIYKPVIHPFKDIKPPKTITDKHINLLRKWASVRASVRDPVRASVRDPVRASVGDSVWDSVWDPVWASVRASVGDSVWDSVWASVGDSVGAYTGSFFKLDRKSWKYTKSIKLKGYPFQHVVKLWELGLVPSFDGTTWRLHGGKDAKILWEGKIK